MNERYWGSSATRLSLGQFVLDLEAGELLQPDGGLAGLRRQALELLLVLGQQPGRVVSKDELMRRVWPGVVVGEGSLSQAIADIRKVLDDKEHKVVRSVARRGYMLVPPALPPAAPPAAAQASGARTEEAPPPRRRRLAALLAALAGVIVLGWSSWTLQRPAPVPGPFSLLVLPLAMEGAEADDRWFVDVLHADLIANVGQLSGVSVISRETAASLRGPQDPRVLARELHVRYVVIGAVRREGERVHLRLAMSDGESGAQPWAQRFDIPRAELHAALDGITRQLARTLQVQMYRASATTAQALPPERLKADDIAMQGWGHYFKGLSPANLKAAMERFESALALDPRSIRAWGGVQASAAMSGVLNWMPRDRALARLQEAVQHLQALDEDDFYTHSAKMFIATLNADWDAMLHSATMAAERFPSHPAPHILRAGALAALGRFEECVDAGRRAVEIGPRDYAVGASYMYIGTCQFMRGHYREAAAAARAGYQANPVLPSPPVLLIASLVELGELEEARTRAAEYVKRNPQYRAGDFALFLRGRHPQYLAGRDRAIADLRLAGFP
jgi:TolB-like protein/DNA-binding winged helix-turn-helix (wHTH) protein